VKQKDHRTKSECKAHLEIFIATIEAIHTTQHKSKNPSKLLGPTKITFPLERKQSLVAGLLIIIIRLLLLLGGGGSAAGGAAPAEVRRQVLHLHLDHVLPHPDVGDVPAGAVDPGGDGRHAERPRRSTLVLGALLREEEAGRGDGRVQPGGRPCLFLPCEVHHLAPADVNSCVDALLIVYRGLISGDI
jgi:hypothetical protein